MGLKLGVPRPFRGGGAESPSNTKSPGPRPTSMPSASLIHPPVFHNRYGSKIGDFTLPFLARGELGPYLTQSRLGRVLPPYQVAPWSLQPFGRNRYAPKIAPPPFGEGELGPHLTQCGQGRAYLHAKFHLDPSNHLATVHQRYRQTDKQDRTDSTIVR